MFHISLHQFPTSIEVFELPSKVRSLTHNLFYANNCFSKLNIVDCSSDLDAIHELHSQPETDQ
jgi:hypothetical protein